MAKKELMLNKYEIKKAVEQSQEVKKKYPAFWKFYEMLLDMNEGLSIIQESLKDEKVGDKKK
jgi:hypothetical protein